MSIKNLVIDLMMHKKGILFVDTLKSSRNCDVFYCVDIETNRYSFWSWKFCRRPVMISNNLNRTDAAFTFSLMGG